MSTKTQTKTGQSLTLQPVANIREDPENARRVFDKASLQSLADSIKSEGILQPLLLVPSGDGALMLVDGHRRFRAAQLAGLSVVPCIVRDDLDEVNARMAAIIANLQREGLTPWEEATAINQALATGEVTQKELATKTGLSLRTVSSRLGLMALGPDVGPLVGRDGFTMEHASMLAPLLDADFYVSLAKAEPKQTQEDADAALRANVIKAALKAVGTGKDTLTVADSVEAVAEALHGANLAFNTEKDRKLIAAAPAFMQAIKKMRHVTLDSRSGVAIILVFDVATYKDKRLAYKVHAKGTERAVGGSKADKAKASKRRETVAAAADLAMRDGILAANPTTSSLAWAITHDLTARPIMPSAVDFALRLANVTDEKAQAGFRALFKNERTDNAAPKAEPKWWQALDSGQAIRLALGVNIADGISNHGNFDSVLALVTGKDRAAWLVATDALVKDEPEPVVQIVP